MRIMKGTPLQVRGHLKIRYEILYDMYFLYTRTHTYTQAYTDIRSLNHINLRATIASYKRSFMSRLALCSMVSTSHM